MEEGKRERGKAWKDGMERDKVRKDCKELTRRMNFRNTHRKMKEEMCKRKKRNQTVEYRARET